MTANAVTVLPAYCPTDLPLGAREPPRSFELLAQQKLDLPIQRPQFVVGPALHGVEQLLVRAQKKRLSLPHRRRLPEDGAGVHHGRRPPPAPHHPHQFAPHLRLPPPSHPTHPLTPHHPH